MAAFFYTPEELAARDELNRPASEFEKYSGPPLTDGMVASAEATLGVRLPAALIDMLRERNGGFLKRPYFAYPVVDDIMALTSLHGLGWRRGMDGEYGCLYMSKEWHYPDGLLYIDGDGHTGIFLDYRDCGPQGEPSVGWYDGEADPPEIVKLDDTFAAFVSRLQEDDPQA
jgi:hypothetical protein